MRDAHLHARRPSPRRRSSGRRTAARRRPTSGVRETRVGAGGQAANVAAWAIALGAEARFVGKRGSDPAGELATARGRAARRRGRRPGRRGPQRRRRLARRHGRRAHDDLRPRASRPSSAPRSSTWRWFRGLRLAAHSGYSLFEAPIDEAAAKAAGAVRAHGGRLSVDLSSASAIEAFGAGAAGRPPRRCSGRTSSSRTRTSSDALGAVAPRRRHGAEARRRTASVVTARSRTRRGRWTSWTRPGAGDALAAGFLVGGAELALETAARCVAQLARCRHAGWYEGRVLSVSEEVEQALERDGPVVALETTLIAHGFPAGEGIAVGHASEAAVRGGRRRAGDGRRARRRASASASTKPSSSASTRRARKVGPSDDRGLRRRRRGRRNDGRRDARGLPGGRHPRAGDRRHRRRPPRLGEQPGRLRRPRRARARRRAVVVCSGVKSLLDVPATLELLETLGVPVARLADRLAPALLLGRRRPAAHRPASDSAAQAAAIARAHWALGGAGDPRSRSRRRASSTTSSR